MFVMANLTDEELAKLRAFEHDNGLHVVAMVDLELRPAMIDAAKVGQLAQLERDLGKTLLAVQ